LAALKFLIGVALGDATVVAGPAPDLMTTVASVWSLAAAGESLSAPALQTVVLRAKDQRLAAMALRLWASGAPPTLGLPEVGPGDAEGLRELRARVLRRTLAPWFDGDGDAERQALGVRDAELAAAVQQPDNDGEAWCSQWRSRMPADSALAAACQRWPAVPQP
jgi:hypothetical protein